MIRKRSSLSPLQHGSDPSWTGVPVGLALPGGASAPAASVQSDDSGEHAGEALVWRYSPGGDDEGDSSISSHSQQARRVPRPSVDGEEDRWAAGDGGDWADEGASEIEWADGEDGAFDAVMPIWFGDENGAASDPLAPWVCELPAWNFEGADGDRSLLALYDPSGDFCFAWDLTLVWDEGETAGGESGDGSSEEMPTDDFACVMVAPEWLGGDGEEVPAEVDGAAPAGNVGITDLFGPLGIGNDVSVCFPGIEIL